MRWGDGHVPPDATALLMARTMIAKDFLSRRIFIE